LPRVEDFVRHARQRGSVLEERNGAYRFLHLALQEFLVARYLSEVTGRDSREAMLSYLAGRLEDPWWREPILLLAGYQAGHAARSARELLRALAETGGAPARSSRLPNWRQRRRSNGATAASPCAPIARSRIVRLLSDGDALVEVTAGRPRPRR
jgi:hypothetical protein